jgi:large subunit ribosomal protein LP0
MEVQAVYDDGSMLDREVVAVSPDDLLSKFKNGVSNITALSLETGIVTECAVPHLIMNAFKNLAAISLESGYEIDELKNMGSGPA